QVLPLALEDIGHLRRQHVIRAARLSFLDQLGGRIDVLRGCAPRAHLHEATAEPRGGRGHRVTCASAGSGSSWRTSSRLQRSSQPPTCVLPMKICGTVRLPCARSTISARRAALPITLISVKVTPLRLSKSFAALQYGQKGVV